MASLRGVVTFVPRTLLAVPRAVASPFVHLSSISSSVTALEDVTNQLREANVKLASVDAEVTAMRRGVDELGVGVGSVAAATAPLNDRLDGVRSDMQGMARDVAGLRVDIEGVQVPLVQISETVKHLKPAAERLERLGTRFGGSRGVGRLPPG